MITSKEINCVFISIFLAVIAIICLCKSAKCAVVVIGFITSVVILTNMLLTLKERHLDDDGLDIDSFIDLRPDFKDKHLDKTQEEELQEDIQEALEDELMIDEFLEQSSDNVIQFRNELNTADMTPKQKKHVLTNKLIYDNITDDKQCYTVAPRAELQYSIYKYFTGEDDESTIAERTSRYAVKNGRRDVKAKTGIMTASRNLMKRLEPDRKFQERREWWNYNTFIDDSIQAMMKRRYE